MSEALRGLLLEDQAGAGDLVRQELGRAGIDTLTARVDSRAAFARALTEAAPDVVLSDHTLLHFGATTALAVLRIVRPTVPLIVVTGVPDERALVACLRAGAEDAVRLTDLTRLRPVIDAALAVREPLRRLSERQIVVLRLLVGGLQRGEIARQLGLSVKTIEAHRAQAMRRLGIPHLPGLVRYAIRVGLVALEAPDAGAALVGRAPTAAAS